MKSKKQQVREHLERYGEITPLEALDKYGSFRLSAIIFDLRKEGMKIETRIDKKKHYANYILQKEELEMDLDGSNEREAEHKEQNRLNWEQDTLTRISENQY